MHGGSCMIKAPLEMGRGLGVRFRVLAAARLLSNHNSSTPPPPPGGGGGRGVAWVNAHV